MRKNENQDSSATSQNRKRLAKISLAGIGAIGVTFALLTWLSHPGTQARDSGQPAKTVAPGSKHPGNFPKPDPATGNRPAQAAASAPASTPSNQAGQTGSVSGGGAHTLPPPSPATVGAPAKANEPADPPLKELSPQGLEDLRTALSKKESRSPAHQKIDSALLGLIPGTGPASISPDGKTDVLDVVITAKIAPALVGQIEAVGGHVRSVFEEHDWMRADIPLSALEPLANNDAVRFIRRYIPPMVNKVNTSEGDVAHRANLARSGFSVSGSGVKIGVISDSASASQLKTLISKGDLPSGRVTVLPGQAGSGSDEGLAMLEIVHDLAPAANLYFATADGGEPVFAQNIRALRDAGCKVIVDDVSNPFAPAFEDGIVAEAVNDVVASGVVYLSSAANSGNANDGQSGVWEGDFRPYRTVNIDGVNYETHDFGGGSELIRITKDGGKPIFLKWADAYGSSGNDYDLVLVDPTGRYLVGISDNSQNGNDDPWEGWRSSNDLTGYYFMIARRVGAQTRFLHLNTNRGRLAGGTSGQIYGHAAAEGCLAIAAVDANAARGPGKVFDGREAVETYSSDGPRRVFYGANGVAITPGNFTSTGGQVRNKPDFSAADKVKCATPGFSPFPGTSAAAPHAAAIVALMLQKNPGLTPAQVRQALVAGSMDIEGSGWDRDSGHGLLNAYTVLQSTPGAGLAAPGSVSATKGTYTDKVQIAWGSVSGATHYRVFRATSATGTQTALGSWQTATSFDDTTAAVGTVYWYWLKSAANSAGANESTFSASDTGYLKEITQLPAPTGVAASDGTYDSMVAVSWNAVSGATHYQVFRATSVSGTPTALGSWQTSTNYYDTSATPGQNYTYWVKAASSASGAQASPLSAPDAGFRKEVNMTAGILSNISWSDSVDQDKDSYSQSRRLNFAISLSQRQDVVFQLSYKSGDTWTIHSTTGPFSVPTGSSDWNITGVGARSPLPHGSYAWKLEVLAGDNVIASESDSVALKYTSFETLEEDDAAPKAPTSVSASDASFQDSVYITSYGAQNATHFRFYRSASIDTSPTPISEWIKETSFFDHSAVPGTYYYYWVKAASSDSGQGETGSAGPDRGYRPLLSAPAQVTASDGTYGDRVTISWSAVTGATHYRISRSTDSYSYKEVIANWQTGRTFTDTTIEQGRKYVYWIQSATSATGENPSLFTSDTGWSENDLLIARIDAMLGNGAIDDFCLTSDEKVYTVNEKGLLRWDFRTGKLLRNYRDIPPLGDDNFTICLAADERTMVISRQFYSDYVIDLHTGERLLEFNGPEGLASFGPDGLLYGLSGKNIVAWDVTSGTVVRSLTGHSSTITSISFAEDFSRFATRSSDGTVRIWDVASGNCIRIINPPSGSTIALSPDGKEIVISRSTTFETYDVDSGSLLDSSPTGVASSAPEMCSPDGIYLYGGGCVWRRDTWDKTLDISKVRLYARPHFVSNENGEWLAATDLEGKLVFYDYRAETGISSAFPIQAYTGKVAMLAVAESGERFITGTDSGDVKVWDAANATPVWSKVVSSCSSINLSKDGRFALVGLDNGSAQLWDIEGDVLVHSFVGHANGVRGVSFSPDEKEVLTASYDYTAKIWNRASGACQLTLAAHPNLQCAIYSGDGLSVFTGGGDAKIRMWDAKTGAPLRTFEAPEVLSFIAGLALSWDGTLIASKSNDGLAVWDVASGGLTGLYDLGRAPQAVYTRAFAFTEDNNQILIQSDPYGNVLDLTTGISTTLYTSGLDLSSSVSSAAMNGRRVYLGIYSGAVKVWEATARPAWTMPGNAIHTDDVHGVAVTSDGTTVLTAGWDKKAIVWDSETGQSKAVFRDSDKILHCDITPDGRYAATSNSTNQITVWDPSSGASVAKFPAGVGGSYSISMKFSHDGNKVVVAGRGNSGTTLVRVLSVPDGQLLQEWNPGGAGNTPSSAVFSHDDRLVASTGDGVCKIWDVATGNLLRTLSLNGTVCEFSKDATKLLMIDGHEAGIWNATTGARLKRFAGHDLMVGGAAYSPDESLVITGSADKLVKVWSVSTQACLKNCIGHTDGVEDVAFLPDGRFVSVEGVGGGTNGIIWKLVTPGDLHQIHVASGFGSGQYAVGEEVYVGGSSPSPQHRFLGWQGDISFLENAASEETRVVMPNRDVSVEAIYGIKSFSLTVNNGSGSGEYPSGKTVSVTASPPPPGQIFHFWAGDTDHLADVTAPSTSLVMPAQAVSIAATYRTPIYALTVKGGTGSGNYTTGSLINLLADTPPAGERFDSWTGDVAELANPASPTTTLTMPAADATVVATYTGYRLTVASGSGGGVYPAGRSIEIAADPAPSGRVFAQWTGDTGLLADPMSPTGTVTIPAQDATLTATYTSVSEDPFGYPETYPTVGMNILGRVELFNQPAAAGDMVAVYSGGELRGKGEVIVESAFAGVNLHVQVAQDGEPLTFKILDRSTNEVHNADLGCTLAAVSGATVGSYPGDLFTIRVSNNVILELSLASGWNQISFNIDFDDPGIRSVLAPVLASVTSVQGASGTFDPDLPDTWNTLSAFADASGYWVQMETDQNLTLTGRALDRLTATVQLSAGWNHVGYPLSGAGQIRTVLADALEAGAVEQVVSSHGSFNPGLLDSINSLSIMKPGCGYWIKASRNYLLTFNANTAPTLTNAFSQNSAFANGVPAPHPFGEPVVYPQPVMTILARVKIDGEDAVHGDAVAAFSGAELRAVAPVSVMFDRSAVVALPVNMNQSGENLTFKIWDAASSQVKEVAGVTVVGEIGANPYSYPDGLLLLDSETPGTFAQWLADKGLTGDAAALFRQDRNGDGVPNGMDYAFGENWQPGESLQRTRFANGGPVFEIPEQDAATLPYVTLRVLGSTDLIDWSRPVIQIDGAEPGRVWYQLDGPPTNKAFFKLEAELK